MKWYDVSWSDGDNPSSGDGCGFLIAQLALAAMALVAALLLCASADDPPIIDDDPHDGNPPPENPHY